MSVCCRNDDDTGWAMEISALWPTNRAVRLSTWPVTTNDSGNRRQLFRNRLRSISRRLRLNTQSSGTGAASSGQFGVRRRRRRRPEKVNPAAAVVSVNSVADLCVISRVAAYDRINRVDPRPSYWSARPLGRKKFGFVMYRLTHTHRKRERERESCLWVNAGRAFA